MNGYPIRMPTAKAAEYLGISHRTLLDYVAGGKVRAYKLSVRHYVFDRSDLDEFLESRATISRREWRGS